MAANLLCCCQGAENHSFLHPGCCLSVAVVPPILVYCSVRRIDSNLLRHRIRKYPDSPVHTLSDSLRIYSTLENGFQNVPIRCRIRRMRVSTGVDGRRIRKEKSCEFKNTWILGGA